MKLTLEGCGHRALEVWGTELGQVTCLSCYERLVVPARSNQLVKAPPPGICDHTNRKPVAAAITRNMPYRDAICTTCGVIQRHPDGRGVWTDVLFYGYVIKEEP